MSIKGVKVHLKDHAGGAAVASEDRLFSFPSESECGLWLAALKHAMSPQAPKSPDVDKMIYSPTSNFLFETCMIKWLSKVLTHAAVRGATTWESLAEPIAVLTK